MAWHRERFKPLKRRSGGTYGLAGPERRRGFDVCASALSLISIKFRRHTTNEIKMPIFIVTGREGVIAAS